MTEDREITSLIDEAMEVGARGDRNHMFLIFSEFACLTIKAAAHRADVIDMIVDRLKQKYSGPRVIAMHDNKPR